MTEFDSPVDCHGTPVQKLVSHNTVTSPSAPCVIKSWLLWVMSFFCPGGREGLEAVLHNDVITPGAPAGACSCKGNGGEICRAGACMLHIVCEKMNISWMRLHIFRKPRSGMGFSAGRILTAGVGVCPLWTDN